MKKLLFIITLFLLSGFHQLTANGICIVDAENGITFNLVSSDVVVSVTDQVATVTATATFHNDLGYDTKMKFGFPMTETASALSLEWLYEGVWHTADFAPEPQDTTLPGGGGGSTFTDPYLKDFLGKSPLYFDLEGMVKADSSITFRLVYVDLLPYAFNKVSFWFPNDYSNLQAAPVTSQSFQLTLHSQRTIEQVELLSHDGAYIQNNGNIAFLEFTSSNTDAYKDFYLEYELDAQELGIFPFSTYLPDSAVTCDDHGQGYFAFIVEPDPSENTAVIQKVFTLIIDKSGSMSGSKITQAREAASFIVENLNLGDKFNLVVFDGNIYTFKPDHVNYTPATRDEALNFISQINAGGSTNISGAFTEAISDFSSNNTDQYNVIIFFTDGEATAGITSTQGILDHVENLIITKEVEGLSIFTFGIGNSVNQQLLTLLANNNQGISEFLKNADLQSTISNFYLTIQNPVLLYPQMTFNPPVIIETHPEHLPNLYKGQQMIVVGRYSEPLDVDVQFSGLAFGQPVAYGYTLSLADSSVQSLQFLPRLWAKQKMKDLYQEFFSQPPGSSSALALEDSIIQISICNGVISPFTSFEDNTGGGVTETQEAFSTSTGIEITPYPNPFVKQVTFQIRFSTKLFEKAVMEIFDARGRLVKTIEIVLDGREEYQLSWDGVDDFGNAVPRGIYYYQFSVETGKVTGTLVRM